MERFAHICAGEWRLRSFLHNEQPQRRPHPVERRACASGCGIFAQYFEPLFAMCRCRCGRRSAIGYRLWALQPGECPCRASQRKGSPGVAPAVICPRTVPQCLPHPWHARARVGSCQSAAKQRRPLLLGQHSPHARCHCRVCRFLQHSPHRRLGADMRRGGLLQGSRQEVEGKPL